MVAIVGRLRDDGFSYFAPRPGWTWRRVTKDILRHPRIAVSRISAPVCTSVGSRFTFSKADRRDDRGAIGSFYGKEHT